MTPPRSGREGWYRPCAQIREEADDMEKRGRNGRELFNMEDPLGLKDADVRPDSTDHIRASSESVRHRRARAGLGPYADDRTTNGMDDLSSDRKGATGMDMGAGGQD